MSTVELLLDRVRGTIDGTYQMNGGPFRLEAVAGRPGSICFTLEETARGVRVSLAEGFSLDGQLVYDRRSLPESEIDRILRYLIDDRAAVRESTTIVETSLASVA